MSKNEADILELEKELAVVETGALEEEKYNAEVNYGYLANEMMTCKNSMPYPDVGRYDVGIDYEERDALHYKKGANKPFYDEIALLDAYYNHNNGSLYSGHVSIAGKDYYIMDSGTLESKQLNGSDQVMLINADDDRYRSAIKGWRYPATNADITLSRNIFMKNKLVNDVDVVYDRGNTAFSGITDAYLRKALIRNKTVPMAQSIIQTIQKKQDEIRLLPAGTSFIAQGCAGSGKTMVLLHRIRYLLYNKYINNNEYIFLVPSNSFKNFIKPISNQFNISSKNVIPYKSYYQALLGKNNEAAQDVSELVFDKEFLLRVYSKKFMQENYEELLNLFESQTNDVIEFFEHKLNELIEFEELLIDESIENLSTDLYEKSKNIVSPISAHLPPIKSCESVPLVLNELQAAYFTAKEKYESLTAPDFQVTISPEDARIAENTLLGQIRKQIEAEEELLKKSSIFTAVSHRRKLAALNAKYSEAYSEIESRLIEEDAAAYAEEAARAAFVYDGISLVDVEEIVSKLSRTYETISDQIAKEQYKKENPYTHLAQKYSEIISGLNQLVEKTAENITSFSSFVANLDPAYEAFSTTANAVRGLIRSFEITLSDSEKAQLQQFKFFTERTAVQFEAYVYTRLLNICKKRLKDEFNIKISKLYKHNWYIELYCQYLTRNIKWQRNSYLFMDEAQDLSESELELIIKINSYTEEKGEFSIYHTPVVNLFGDVNQTITGHGINSWDLKTLKHNDYELNENFRNPNEIVDYCNEQLLFKMQKVGVSTEPVAEYISLSDAMSSSKTIFDSPVIIVKDEYAKKDVIAELECTEIKDYKVYTVLEVKGLEFKEVFVFDRGMTDNEKYISYTRPLSKLTVIKTLPELFSKDEILYEQGEDTEDSEDV